MDSKTLAALCFEAETRLADIDASLISAYHLAYATLLDVYKEHAEEDKHDAE